MDPMMSRLIEIARVSALSELASGVAHEINQPLAVMTMLADAGTRMLERAQVARAIEVFREISREALNAGEGIRRVRRLFDPAPGTRVPCRLPDLVAELRPLLEALTGRIGARLVIEVPPELPEVRVDPVRIQHVLFSLVQNACEASDGCERPEVRVCFVCDRYALETRISDSGPDIPSEIAEQLFRPFFTTKSHGTGLGLASSRAAIEAHGGTMGFEAGAGRKYFWFRLPLGSEHESA